jgi:NAD-dependent dihydropyrimidine dehydrogenase PreA subunit
MFVSSLAKRIADRAIEEHPVFLPNRCINMLHRELSCTICRNNCKNNVFSEYGPHFDKCTNCNLCLALCPTQAIIPATHFLRQLIRHSKTEEGTIHISCEKRKSRGDINLYCLASLPWELYVALALNKAELIQFLM